MEESHVLTTSNRRKEYEEERRNINIWNWMNNDSENLNVINSQLERCWNGTHFLLPTFFASRDGNRRWTNFGWKKVWLESHLLSLSISVPFPAFFQLFSLHSPSKLFPPPSKTLSYHSSLSLIHIQHTSLSFFSSWSYPIIPLSHSTSHSDGISHRHSLTAILVLHISNSIRR